MKTTLNLYDKKGLSMIECIVALFLTTATLISLMIMHPLAWQSAGKSDYLGRAEGILQRELEANELSIMRSTSTVPPTIGTNTTCADYNGNILASCTTAGKFFTITASTANGAIANTWL